MTTRNHSKATLTLAALAGLALAAGSARAATIYDETFSSSGDLNGTAPDVTTGGATWTASLDWNQDGTADVSTGTASNNDDNAFLPFTPLAGNEYTLTATIDVASGSWFALGFAQSNSTEIDFWASPNDTTSWVLVRASGEVDSFSGDSGQGGANPGLGGNVDLGIHTMPMTVAMVLDTTGAEWTAEWLVDGSSERTVTYTTGNPTGISHVGFGRTAGSLGTIDDFSLTVIPEPSAAALLGLGGLALLFRRRK